MNILPVVLSSIAGTIIIVFIGVAAWRAFSGLYAILKCLPEIRESSAKIAASIDKYLSIEDHLKNVPILIEGQTKMCAAEVVALNEVRKAVKGLQEAIFKRDDIRSLETPTDGEKNLAWEAKRIQQENPGIDYATAMMKAVEQEVKDLNGAGVGGFSL